MLHNADYIYENILKADNINTTLDHCKKAQVGVDLSVRKIYEFRSEGVVFVNSTTTPNYHEIPAIVEREVVGREGFYWHLNPGTYIIEVNEGCSFGPQDTGFVIMRSSLNRSGVSIASAVWDPGYTSVSENGEVHPMSIRMTVENPYGFDIYVNARIAQLVVATNDSASLYAGQFQGGRLTSE